MSFQVRNFLFDSSRQLLVECLPSQSVRSPRRWFSFTGTRKQLDYCIKQIARDFDEAKIRYCVIGGNALAVHGCVAATLRILRNCILADRLAGLSGALLTSIC